MRYKNLKVYSKPKNKCNLTRIMSGVITPLLVFTTLSGCTSNKNKYNNYKDYEEYYDYKEVIDNYLDFNQSTTLTTNMDDKTTTTHVYNNYPNFNQSTTTTTDINNTTTSTRVTNNYDTGLSLELDDYSMGIVNSKITLDNDSINSFTNYVKSINVSYLYSELYGTQSILNKYESIGNYNSNATSLFINNQITGYTIYSIVKNNNQNANLTENQTMSDSDLRQICEIISDVLNKCTQGYSSEELKLISEKINDLKILKFDDFSNGYYDATKGKMGFNVSYLKSKSNDFFRKTVEHETFHFIQANSIGESSKLNFDDRYGFSYKFFDTNVNSLSWNWYYEGSAEYLTCNLNNNRHSEVYGSVIKSMDTIKVATVLSNKNSVDTFEKLSLSNDLNKLFDYFGCQNTNDKIEILNLMYSYNIIFDINFSCDDFYNQYELIYGTEASKRSIERELNDSIGQTLTKQFYKNLAQLLKDKEVKVEEIFSLISVFENEISREIWYNSNQATLTTFFDVYGDIQTRFFDIIAKKLNISTEDVQQAYNSFNKEITVNLDAFTLINDNEKNFYKYILDTRKNDKMNSINYVSEKYNNSKVIK